MTGGGGSLVPKRNFLNQSERISYLKKGNFRKKKGAGPGQGGISKPRRNMFLGLTEGKDLLLERGYAIYAWDDITANRAVASR